MIFLVLLCKPLLLKFTVPQCSTQVNSSYYYYFLIYPVLSRSFVATQFSSLFCVKVCHVHFKCGQYTYLYFLNKIAGKLEVKVHPACKEREFCIFCKQFEETLFKNLLCVVSLSHLPCD